MPDEASDSASSGAGQYPRTHWSVVLSAGRGNDTRAQVALTRLCQTYWYPLYAFVRRHGYSPEDAQDLTQGFFAHLLEHHALAGVHPAKGTFRAFLLASLRHFLANERARAKPRSAAAGARWFHWTPRPPRRALGRKQQLTRVPTRPTNGTGRWCSWNRC